MKYLLRLLAFIALTIASVRASDADIIAAVRAADDERVAATMAGHAGRIDAIYSDELHYAHSSGTIDTKASYARSLTSKSTVYASVDYKTRNFRVAAPGIVLMTGHAIIHAGPNGRPNVNDLNYLAVWRLENGKWRFLAWQSCKNPPAAPTK